MLGTCGSWTFSLFYSYYDNSFSILFFMFNTMTPSARFVNFKYKNDGRLTHFFDSFDGIFSSYSSPPPRMPYLRLAFLPNIFCFPRADSTYLQ